MKRLFNFLTPDRANLFGFLSFLAASPAYFYCRTHHFCVFGHLLHPEDITLLDHANDILWRLGFLCSLILGFFSGVTFRYVFVFALGVGYLFFVDPSGITAIAMFPVQAALCIFAVCCLKGWLD